MDTTITNIYKILHLFKVVEDGFKLIIGRDKTTCQFENENKIKAVDKINNVDTCKGLCASDDKCNYLYYNKVTWCVTFKTCDKDERATRSIVGDTYIKTGNTTKQI